MVYKVALVLAGLSLGSFTSVFASRYPKGESLWRYGSRCPRCHTPIKPYHNIPVLGWLILRGRCAGCHGAIAWRYPMMEISFGMVTALFVWRFGLDPLALGFLAFYWGLLLISWVDWETSYIFDVTSYPLLAAGLLVSWLWGQGAWWLPLAGAALMFALMEGSYQTVRLVTGREALGGGDVKLMAAAGAFLGPWAGLRSIVFVAVLSPFYWMVTRKVKNLGPRDPFPFGPALAMGCAISAWELLGGDMGNWLRRHDWHLVAEYLLL